MNKNLRGMQYARVFHPRTGADAGGVAPYGVPRRTRSVRLPPRAWVYRKTQVGKSGMLSAFIIVGIIFLALIALGLYASDSITSLFTSPTSAVENFVKECLIMSAEYAIVLQGENADPTKTIEQVQETFQNDIATSLPKCIKDFSAFKDLTIRQGTPLAQAEFTNKDIKVTLRYTLDITKKETTYQKETFTISLPVRFKTLHEAAQYIHQTKAETGGIDLTALGEKDFVTDIYEQGPTLIFTDPKSKVDNHLYTYTFSP